MQKSPTLVIVILLTFFVISFISNIIGPIIPDLIRSFHLNLTLVSLLPFSFFIAYGITSIPAGMLLETFKERKIMLAAFVLAGLGSLLFVLFPNFWMALTSLFLIGTGMAMLQVVINPLLRTAGGEEHYASNSVYAQLVFGLASFISPMVYQFFVQQDIQLLSLPFPWLSLYLLFVGINLVMFVICSKITFPVVPQNAQEKPEAWAVHLQLFKNKTVFLYFLAMLCYVGTEQGISTWVSQFLDSYHHLNPQTFGANTIAYYWGLMTLGGVFGIILLKFFDSRTILSATTFFAIVALAFGLFGNSTLSLIAFPLIGFFVSLIYPIIFSLALNSVKEHHGAFSGIIVTGIVGGAIFPFLIGGLGDLFGLKIGMTLLFFSLSYIFSIGFWAKPLVSNK